MRDADRVGQPITLSNLCQDETGQQTAALIPEFRDYFKHPLDRFTAIAKSSWALEDQLQGGSRLGVKRAACIRHMRQSCACQKPHPPVI